MARASPRIKGYWFIKFKMRFYIVFGKSECIGQMPCSVQIPNVESPFSFDISIGICVNLKTESERVAFFNF